MLALAFVFLVGTAVGALVMALAIAWDETH